MGGFIKKYQQIKDVQSTLLKMKNDLYDEIYNTFVNRQCNMKEVEIVYRPTKLEALDSSKIINLYFPVLTIPEGYVKEGEEFFRVLVKGINHKYKLRDEQGETIEILECANIGYKLYKVTNSCEELQTSIIHPNVNYSVKFGEEEYYYQRIFNYGEMFNQIFNDKVNSPLRYFK